MNPPSFFHANSRTKSVLFCRQTWPPFHVVAKQVLTYVRCRVKKHTQQWIQLNEQVVIVKVPYCEICKIFVFMNTTIIVFQAEVLKGFTIIILLLSPDKKVNLQIRGTSIKTCISSYKILSYCPLA